MRSRLCLALLGGALLTACAGQPSRTWELPATAKSIQVNGYDMAYVERGSGTPLVLVHGAMSDFRYFTASMDALAKQHRVIAVSLRHYYPEPWKGTGDTFSLRQHAADVAEFIKKVDLGPVHLFGHSRGGTVVLFVARDNPRLLRSLTVGEGGSTLRAFDAAAPQPGQPIGAAGVTKSTLALLEQGKEEEAAINFVNGVSGASAWAAAPDFIKGMVRSNIWTTKGAALDVPGPYDCSEVANLRLPVLLMQGEKTTPNYLAQTEALEKCFKGSQRSVIPNAAHVFPRQAPAAFSEALLKFTAQH